MITIGGKEITAAYVGKRALSAVYAGARLVWSAISSCFGLGYWKVRDFQWADITREWAMRQERAVRRILFTIGSR
jgi:hypothetical protein